MRYHPQNVDRLNKYGEGALIIYQTSNMVITAAKDYIDTVTFSETANEIQKILFG